MSSVGALWLLAYVAGCVAALVNPLYGLITYLFAYYSNPPLHWWGHGLPDLRYSLTISLITLGSYLGRRSNHNTLGFFSHPQSIWLVGLVLTSLCVTPFAVDPTLSLEYATKLGKLLALYFIFTKLIHDFRSYRLLVLAHILGGLSWGLEAYFNPETEGGRLINIGGPDSDTSNLTGAHILTILPFVGYYVLARTGWERWLSLLAAPFILRALVMINSRGAMLALAAAGVFALVFGPRRIIGRSLVALVVCVAAIFVIGGDVFLRRQTTLFTYEDDYSATSRIEMWQAAVRMVKDHPFGVGGHGYDLMSPKYLPDMVEKRDVEQTVHNTYLMAAAEWGIPGLIFLVGFIGSVFLQLSRVRRMSITPDLERRLRLETSAVGVGVVGLLVAGFFLNRLYGEALYWLGGLSAGLANIANRGTQDGDVVREDSAPPPAAGPT